MVGIISTTAGAIIAIISVIICAVRIRSYKKRSIVELETLKADYDKEREKVLSCKSHIQELSGTVSDCERRLTEEQSLVKEKISELEKSTKKISIQGREIERQNEKAAFIASVVNAQPEPNEALSEFKHLLEEDYQTYANSNDSLAEEARAMKQLQDVQSQLELVTHDAQLIGKNIIAIGGAFSSGKSSFMNSLFMQDKTTLPVGMDQTTAIASYVLNGERTEIIGYSYTGGKVAIPENIFALFSYGKEDEFKFNMKRIIDQIVFKTEFMQPFENICFVDTPGFNPGANAALDYDTAKTAIANAQVLLWCFDITGGTIRSDEISILQDILDKNPDIKIYVVANRADLRSVEESEEVISQTEQLLESNFIQYEGISLYTSTEKFNEQPMEYASVTRKKSLQDFLSESNSPNMQKEQSLLAQVKDVFDGYIAADKERIKRIENQIKTFSSIENSFAQISGKKDEIIAYYKARRSKKFKTDSAPSDSDAELDSLSDGMAEIKADLQKTLQQDKADIRAAEELCKKFRACILHIFGHKADFAKTARKNARNKAGNSPVSVFIKSGTEPHIWVWQPDGMECSKKMGQSFGDSNINMRKLNNNGWYEYIISFGCYEAGKPFSLIMGDGEPVHTDMTGSFCYDGSRWWGI